MIIQQLGFKIQTISNSGTAEHKCHQKHQKQNQKGQKKKNRGRRELKSTLKGNLCTSPLIMVVYSSYLYLRKFLLQQS